MKHFLILTLAVISLSPSACGQDSVQSNGQGKQQAVHLDAQIRVQMDYLLYVPEDYDQQDSWPLVLFLHGSGERGDDIEAVKKHGPPRRISEGKQYPCLVVSPQCPAGQSWDPFVLTALLDDVCSKWKVDPDRIAVTGLSMGGFGTWQLAAHSPRRFSAIAPVCGGGETRWARRMTHLPIWLFHGAKDQAVPLMRSQEMADAVRLAGGQVQLTIYPDAEHDSWTRTYDDADFWKWLLEQKRVAE